MRNLRRTPQVLRQRTDLRRPVQEPVSATGGWGHLVLHGFMRGRGVSSAPKDYGGDIVEPSSMFGVIQTSMEAASDSGQSM